ncbi:MAG: MOSC domain-containing protein [Tepidisphaeraceae bacterium]
MSAIATVKSLWRYPVKSMAGEELNAAFLGFAGIYGDRFFAFISSAAPKGFPFFTAREQPDMLRYRPRFRSTDAASLPTNLSEAEKLAPGVTPVYPESADLMVDVLTPSGETFAIDDSRLGQKLLEGLRDAPRLKLLRSDRALTDCRPVSLFSVQTVEQLGQELHSTLDKRRFRANIYLDFRSARGFAEHELVGKSLRMGEKSVVSILERDPRCKMITLDPDSCQSNPAILRQVAQNHDGMAGVYAAVLVEGMVRAGDSVELMD